MNKELDPVLRDFIITMYSGIPSSLIEARWRGATFSEIARQTLMSCVGFIYGVYASGNINLATKLANDLDFSFSGLLRNSEDTLLEVSTDLSSMSFAFLLLGKLSDQSRGEQLLREFEQGRGPLVRKIGFIGRERYYGKIFNGGIIFHGSRYIHKLEDDHGQRWWSVHT